MRENGRRMFKMDITKLNNEVKGKDGTIIEILYKCIKISKEDNKNDK